MHRWPVTLLALPLTLVATCAACSSGSRSGTAPSEPVCTPPPVEPDVPRTLRSGGEDRRYLLAVPDEAPPDSGFPLLVSFHGHGGSAAEHEADTSLAAEARSRGYVVATPDGLGDPARWNFDERPGGPDDYAFLAELVDDLVGVACIDPARVHLVGSSNGAAFAGLLACTGDVDVAAVAMVIASVPPVCPPDRRPSALTIRGTADATVPYAGVEDLIANWADHDGCRAAPRTDEPFPGVTRTSYPGCASGRQVVLVAVAGGVHTWPGSVAAADRPGNSAAGAGYSATDAVLAFFDEVDPLR